MLKLLFPMIFAICLFAPTVSYASFGTGIGITFPVSDSSTKVPRQTYAAVHFEQLTEELTAKYGASVAVDMKTLGKGIYAVDDDGHVKRHSEAWNCGNVMIVLENDGDDLEVTYVDLGAAYLP